jgi:hypothetical protein
MIDWFVLGLGVPSQQKFFERVLIMSREYVAMASLANTLAKMVATLEPEQMVEAFLLSQGVHNCIEYDFAENGVELHSKMRWVLSELGDNPGVFDPSIWNSINEEEVLRACQKIHEQHRQKHEMTKLAEIL